MPVYTEGTATPMRRNGTRRVGGEAISSRHPSAGRSRTQSLAVIVVFSALVVGLFLAGCGYHLSGHHASIVAGKGVAIPVFSNRSYKPNLETALTGALVDEFALRSGGTVVREDAAELILSGSVVSYESIPVSYSADDKIRQYRAVVTAEAVLREKGSGKILWKGELSRGEDYPANANLALQQNSEDAAIREACRKLSRDVYEKTTENF